MPSPLSFLSFKPHGLFQEMEKANFFGFSVLRDNGAGILHSPFEIFDYETERRAEPQTEEEVLAFFEKECPGCFIKEVGE